MITAEAENLTLRALVVDDDAYLCKLVAAALEREGFECETAADGETAWRLLSAPGSRHDLVVTDLTMPCRHGHSLSVELLAKANRPTVVVLTGLVEPRLAKDLMARGLDDIVFKPVNLAAFAAKMWSLTKRRLQAEQFSRASEANAQRPPQSDGRHARVSAAELEFRLCSVANIPPASAAAVEVFKIAGDPESSARQVAAAVERDPALLAEVIRAVNCPSVNPTGKRICDVEQAISRLGQKRVADMALSTASLATIAQERIPFFPLNRVRRKCVAAGLCLEVLLKHAFDVGVIDGLFGAAILQPMGRVMLASAFPEVYESLVEQCESQHKPLAELESDAFPRSAGEIIATALASWGIPEEIHGALRYATQSFGALAVLPEVLRRRVELIKTAAFLGELVAGHFCAWDLIDIPPTSVLKRLGMQVVEPLLEHCRLDLDAQIPVIKGENRLESARAGLADAPAGPALAYKRLNSGTIDFVPALVGACGVRLIDLDGDVCGADEPVLINALNAPVHQCLAQARAAGSNSVTVLADAQTADRLRACGQILALPCSFGRLKHACLQASATDIAV